MIYNSKTGGFPSGELAVISARRSGKSSLTLTILRNQINLNITEAESRIKQLESLLAIADMLPPSVLMQESISEINSELELLHVSLDLYKKQLDKLIDVMYA